MTGKPAFQTKTTDRGKRLADYWPLAVLVTIALLSATAQNLSDFTWMGWMHSYMGIFLCLFAMLKLFHPKAFVSGLRMYDPLAKRVRAFGYLYPYVELALGLGYLAYTRPALLYIVTIVFYGWGMLTVLLALRRGLNINCPCMGTVLNVPLSTVTLTEDLMMIAMAGWMLSIG